MTDRESYLIDKIISHDDYVKREGISASQLNKPALQLWLAKEFYDHKSDVTLENRFSAKLGTAWHSFCELGLKDEEVDLEHTLEGKVDNQILTGTYDMFDFETNILYDHKTMQHWKATALWEEKHPKHADYLNEYIPQMSQLKYLWEENPIYKDHPKVKAVKIIVWVVDWKKPYIRKDGTAKEVSPKWFTIEIPTMSKKQFEEYVRNKIREMEKQNFTLCDECPDGWRKDYCDYVSVCPILNKGF